MPSILLPRFKSQANNVRFFQSQFESKFKHVKETKINRKSGRGWSIFFKKLFQFGVRLIELENALRLSPPPPSSSSSAASDELSRFVHKCHKVQKELNLSFSACNLTIIRGEHFGQFRPNLKHLQATRVATSN